MPSITIDPRGGDANPLAVPLCADAFERGSFGPETPEKKVAFLSRVEFESNENWTVVFLAFVFIGNEFISFDSAEWVDMFAPFSPTIPIYL